MSMFSLSGRRRILQSLDQKIAHTAGYEGGEAVVELCQARRAAIAKSAENAESLALARWFARVRVDLVDTILYHLDRPDFGLWVFDDTFPQNISVGVFVDYPADIPRPQYKAYLRAMLQQHIVAKHPCVCVELWDETPELAASVSYTIYCTD